MGSCGCFCCIWEAEQDSAPASPELLTLNSSRAPAPLLAEPSPHRCNRPDVGLRLVGGPEDRLAACLCRTVASHHSPCAELPSPRRGCSPPSQLTAVPSRLPGPLPIKLMWEPPCRAAAGAELPAGICHITHPAPQTAPSTHGAGLACPVPWACKGTPWEGSLAPVSSGWAFLGPAGCLASASLLCLAEQVSERDRHWPGCPIHRDEQAGLQLQPKVHPSG